MVLPYCIICARNYVNLHATFFPYGEVFRRMTFLYCISKVPERPGACLCRACRTLALEHLGSQRYQAADVLLLQTFPEAFYAAFLGCQQAASVCADLGEVDK